MNAQQKIVYDVIVELTEELQVLEEMNPQFHSVLGIPADTYTAPDYDVEKISRLRDKIREYKLRLIELTENV